jgi:hypothetical protein
MILLDNVLIYASTDGSPFLEWASAARSDAYGVTVTVKPSRLQAALLSW